MKIYTRTGDDGETGLFGGGRVSKASARVEAYGSVDELNARIGWARAEKPTAETDALLERVQALLFVVGAELACVPGKEDKLGMALVDADAALALETDIDRAEAPLPPLKTFILPGGSRTAAALHVARTAARRAERLVVGLADPPARAEIVIFLNRLSDLLFVLARRENFEAGTPDTPWTPRQSAD